MADHETMGSMRMSVLAEAGFEEVPSPSGFDPLWRSFASRDGSFDGRYHLCTLGSEWNIVIHDFTLAEDQVLEFDLPDYLSVSWHESISGEELSPYRKLKAKALWGFCSGGTAWRGLIHGGIPVKSVGIEVSPAMSATYLEREYGGQFERVRDAFLSLNDMHAFPEMRALLMGLVPQSGDEGRTAMYYEGKVLEALGLLVERTRRASKTPSARLSPEDICRIRAVAAYIDDHAPLRMSVPDLSRAACMSPTKFKACFRAETGLSVTSYIQQRRVSMAEALLRQPDLSIAQVGRAVGYTCASRFSEIFRRETGLLPSEYRQGFTEAK